MQDDMKRAVDSLAEPADPSLFVASNGLRFRLSRVSRMVMTDAARRLKAPPIPRTFIPEKEREEENPSDPAYIEAYTMYRYDMGMLAVTTYFILGTKVEGELPAGMCSVKDDDWADNLRAVDPNIEIPPDGPRRYLAWLKYYALSDADQSSLVLACQRYSGGTLEVDVAQAQATFRDRETRDSADGVHTAPEDTSGDNNGVGAGSSSGVRGEGSSDIRLVPVGQVDNTAVL